ncbi:PDC sensor domain-containing protein [Pseudoxanthomonas sp. NC8]|nr:PDC sensor domain-containing protein [Pseudoxanthomonas sp. NC8]
MTSPHRQSQTSIATRMMLGIALLALLCFGLTAAISYRKSSRALLATSQQTLQELVGREAQRTTAELSGVYDTASTLARTLLLQRQQGILTREGTSALIRDQLEAHPEWLGVGTLWEPAAFDDKDAKYVGTEGHDETGRFMSYWVWNDGTPLTEALRNYEVPGDGDWYLKPRELKAPMLLEPYEYAIGGKTVLMTTLAMPILENGQFLGVVTVDIALSSLQERLSKLAPMVRATSSCSLPVVRCWRPGIRTKSARSAKTPQPGASWPASPRARRSPTSRPMPTARSRPMRRCSWGRPRSASRSASSCRAPC